MKKTTTITICLAGAGAMFFAGRGCGRNSGGEVGGGSGRVETRVDMVIVRDTLRETLLVPVDRLVVRFDTVWLPTDEQLRITNYELRNDSDSEVTAEEGTSERSGVNLTRHCREDGIVQDDAVAANHTATPSTANRDSIQVVIPIEQKIYMTADYRAVVEGFRPSLVELEIYRSTARITRETIRSLPPQRWGIGIQAGWGFTPKGTGPYLGVGVQYRLAAW